MGRPKDEQKEPITGNKDVKELWSFMKNNNIKEAKDLLDVVKQINKMEQHLASAVNELAAMRAELEKAEKASHPVRQALRNCVIKMQSQVLHLRDKLAELKQGFIEGCREAMAEIKEDGIAALASTVRFLKVRAVLEETRQDLTDYIGLDDASIKEIENASTKYHKVGLYLKNIGKVIADKDTLTEAKPIGNIAKAFALPYRAERNCLAKMKQAVEKALDSIGRLESRAAEKPSINETLKSLNEKVAQEKNDAPTKERPLKVKAER